MEEETKEVWYEIAVSYTDDKGTETIERKTYLNEAIDYAKNCSELQNENVDFVFVDKWYYYEDKTYKDYTFKSQIIINNQ
jgi:hypothetical protein